MAVNNAYVLFFTARCRKKAIEMIKQFYFLSLQYDNFEKIHDRSDDR